MAREKRERRLKWMRVTETEESLVLLAREGDALEALELLLVVLLKQDKPGNPHGGFEMR